jgi:hypothetical protein
MAWGGYLAQTNVPSALSNVVAIAAGEYHSLALKLGGSVVAWGDPNYATVPLGLSNIIAVAAGFTHSVALKSDGSVVAWGSNLYGQTNVPGGLSDVIAIAAGGAHTLALKGDGSVVAWGLNDYGAGSVPTAAQSGVSLTAAGYYHNLYKKNGVGILAWGDNSFGQTNVPPGLTNVAMLAGGISHSLALVAQSPVLKRTPLFSKTVSEGTTTNLNAVNIGGAAQSFQWFLNGSAINGATTSNLTFGNFGYTNAGFYSALAWNNYGTDSVQVAVLRLANSPVVLVDSTDPLNGSIARVDSAQITMSNTGSGAAIYFTLDGSAPDFTKIPYTGPFTLTNSATIRAIAYNFAFIDSAEAAPINVQVWPTYPLSATTPGGGSIGLSPAPYSAGNRYVSNTVVTLTATPASNWSFLGWTGDSSATSNVTSVLMDRARTVAGGFGTALNLFTNGSGQVQLNPPGGPYAFGSTVKITALPSPGYYFFGWANAASGFGNPLAFTVTNASGITANFGALAGNQVSLVILPNGNGAVSVSPAKNVYTNGEAVTLTAVPAVNQTFTGWSGDASGNLNPLALTLTTSKLITASFAPGSPTNPPVITQPPLSRTLSAGADTLLSFVLTGDGPFAYQWRLNHSPIAGATNPTLNLVDITPTDAGRYEIAVIGAGGAVTSAPASVAIFGMQLIPSGGPPLPLLILDGAIGTQYQLETSPNPSFSNWSLLSPVTLPTTRFYYADTASSNQPVRFYRAVPQ